MLELEGAAVKCLIEFSEEIMRNAGYSSKSQPVLWVVSALPTLKDYPSFPLSYCLKENHSAC